MTARKHAGQGIIWVQSDPSIDGTGYISTIHYTEDVSYPLSNDDDALAYAATLLRAVAEAEYDAAICAQLTALADGYPKGPGRAGPTFIVDEFRELRGGVRAAIAGPLSITPGVSAYTGQPFFKCCVGELTWQWDATDVKEHVTHVLEVGTAARLDGLYLRLLTGADGLGLDDGTARSVVNGIARYRR